MPLRYRQRHARHHGVLPDFAAQCEAIIEVAPPVASSIMGLFLLEVVARLKARGIRSAMTETFASLDLRPAPYPVQRALMVPVRTAADAAGDATRMQSWAGQGAALSRPEPADALMRQLWEDAQALVPWHAPLRCTTAGGAFGGGAQDRAVE
jgi:hypothetical protein